MTSTPERKLSLPPGAIPSASASAPVTGPVPAPGVPKSLRQQLLNEVDPRSPGTRLSPYTPGPMATFANFSPVAKPSTDDVVLGSVGRMIKSPTLDRLAKLINSYSGRDKLFVLIQCTLKLLIPVVSWRARMQHQHGKRPAPTSNAAASMAKLADLIGAAGMLWRLFGLIPTLQWLSNLEKNPPASRWLRTIERLQAFSMLVYNPVEHMYYFGSQGVYTIPPDRLKTYSLWSTRAWAAYVVLHFLHIREDVALLVKKGQELRLALKDAREKPQSAAMTEVQVKEEYKKISKRRSILLLDFIANLAYFPGALHGSLVNGWIVNDLWITLCGFIAGVASFKAGWDATEL